MDEVVIRFAGDSGDGMQLTGTQFTSSTALFGNDLSTLPDFPAEIRAPAGTLPGVSGFQIRLASRDIHYPGDEADVLVAMNPAALKASLGEVKPGGLIILNSDTFTERELLKAGYDANPMESGALSGYQVIPVEMTRLTRKALESTELSTRAVDRCKNFFALGMMLYLFDRPTNPSFKWVEEKFKRRPELVEANSLALRAGIALCEATEVFHERYRVGPAKLPPGTYRNMNGNLALCLGLLGGSRQSGRPLFLAGYPITPASEIIHELSRHARFGTITFQAEDEIAAIGAALGASFAGHLGATATSGPGLDLKAETIGLAGTAELPLVILNIQRAGPSTGMPTKTEQSDLMLALFGRHGETPLPVLAASSPGDCFWTAIEACRIAVKYMTPVIVLSDTYLANGSEPWRIPSVEDLPRFPVTFVEANTDFLPYSRDPETRARPWAIPGTAGLEHRIGGLEKEDGTGNVSYDADNHEHMTQLRADKIERIAEEIPACQVEGDPDPDLLVLGWGSTLGQILGAVRRAQGEGINVSNLHLRHLNPLPPDLGNVLARAKRVLVPEINSGQLVRLIRDKYLVDARSYTKVRGKPFRMADLTDAIRTHVKG
jgi:2-oxoglutarate ferredoxin oxidoreductase subunit alpha